MPDDVYLPQSYLLNNYQLAEGEGYVLGAGGFGITYYAVDVHLNRAVAIKEYMPRDYAQRNGTEVLPVPGMKDGLSCEEAYYNGLQKFREEGRKLARFDHQHINRVLAHVEANSTTYLVLEYIHGESLFEVLERDEHFEEERLRRLLNQVLSGLEVVHSQHIYHRDLKPGNIMLRAGTDGGATESAVLIDFGAARENLGDHPHSHFQAFTQGYAAIEQETPLLAKDYGIGPWTDLYALGMVAYRCLVGISDQDLINATSRLGLVGLDRRDEDLPSAEKIGKGHYTDALLKTVDWAMRVNPQSRPQSVAEMREALVSGVVPVAHRRLIQDKPRETMTRQSDKAAVPPVNTTTPPTGGTRRVLWSVLGLVALGVASGGWLALQKSQESENQPATEAESQEAKAKLQEEERQRLATEAEAGRQEEERQRLAAEAEAGRQEDERQRLAAEAEVRRQEKERQRLAAEAEARRQEDERQRLAAEEEAGRQEDVAWGVADAKSGDLPATIATINNQEKVMFKYGDAQNAWLDGIAELASYLEVYPNGQYAPEARTRIKLMASTRSNDNFTPLHWAAGFNNTKTAEILIANGADVNARAVGTARDPVTRAFSNVFGGVELLLTKGNDVDARWAGGGVPLHFAALNDAIEVAKVLIENGADVNARSLFGKTPLQIAKLKNNSDMETLLKENGATTRVVIKRRE